MGFLNAEPDGTPEVPVVATSRGRLTIEVAGQVAVHAKARVFVTEGREVVVITPEGRGVHRDTFAVVSSSWDPSTKLLSVDFDGDEGPGHLTLDANGCGCGMGVVGNAGPTDGPYTLVKVRAPEWHSG